jgi:hypothetical protein
MTPWEETARQELQEAVARLGFDILECFPSAHESRKPQERFDLNLLLDPLTDYIFDIEADPGIPRPPDQPVEPLFRRAFTTSRYQTLGTMIGAIAASPLRHRLVNTQPLTVLANEFPITTAAISEQALEQALLDSGWGGLQPAQQPTITVIWSSDLAQPPHFQPAGLLLDLPEPLWRWRLAPQKVIDSSDPNKAERYELHRDGWLELVETSAGQFIHRFLYTPGGGRTLAVFRQGLSGFTLDLAIKKYRNEILDGATGQETLPLRSFSLSQPPWEVEA